MKDKVMQEMNKRHEKMESVEYKKKKKGKKDLVMMAMKK